MSRWRWAALAVVAGAAACSLVHERAAEPGPISRPGGDAGTLLYTVGRLSFQAPAAWEARGDPRRVLLTSPDGGARVDAQLGEKTFPDDTSCLAQAQDALAKGEAKLQNVRRHPTTVAGRKAVVQEADDPRGWHGWAWALCDGGEQYRVFFTGRSPIDAQGVEVARLLPATATLATRPGA
jgi:hypothetical protein